MHGVGGWEIGAYLISTLERYPVCMRGKIGNGRDFLYIIRRVGDDVA